MLGENNYMSFRNMAETSSGDPYIDLGWAVIGQAIQDYYTDWVEEHKYRARKRECDKLGKTVPKPYQKRRRHYATDRRECEQFFKSEYFKLLSQNKLPDEKVVLLMDILKEKAKSKKPFHTYRTELMNLYFGETAYRYYKFNENTSNNGKSFYH